MFAKIRAIVVCVLVVTCGGVLAVQAQDEAPEKYLELFRSDLRATKIDVLTDALDLTQEQGEAFWPIYRQYEQEYAVLGDRRVALIRDFSEKYGTLTDADAAAIAKESFSIQKERLKLREKYYRKVEKAISSLVAARFIQVDQTLNMMIDLQIAAELPLLE